MLGLLDFINGYQPAVGAGAWPQQVPQQGLLNGDDAAAAQAAQDAAGQQLQRLMGRRSLSGPGVPFLPSDTSMSGMLNGYSVPQSSPATTVASSPDVMAPTTQQGNAGGGDIGVPLPAPRPMGAPGAAVPASLDTTSEQAPMSLAPTPPSSPNVPDTSLAGRLGLGDKLGAAFHGFANSRGRGLLGAISDAATGAETGQRQDPQGLAVQSRQALFQAALAGGASPQQALSYSLAPQQTAGVLPKSSMHEAVPGFPEPVVTNPFSGAVSKAPAGVPPNVAGQPEPFQRQYFMTSKSVPNGARYYDPATKRTMVRMGDRVIWADSGKPVQ